MRILFVFEGSDALNGSTKRNDNILKVLRSFSEVDVYEIRYRTSKYHRIFGLSGIPNEDLLTKTAQEFDHVVVSTYVVSPFFLRYRKILSNPIYYLCDSNFHIFRQSFSLKYFAASLLGCLKESIVLINNRAAFLGEDEVWSIPMFFRRNALIWPFYIEPQGRLFDRDGFVTFVGDYNFEPNIMAVKEIIKIAQHSSYTFKLFGVNADRIDSAVGKLPDNVIIMGYVDRIEQAFDGACCMIYPIRFGTGVKNKVIEAISFRVPVVGTSQAFTNLGVDSVYFETNFGPKFSERSFLDSRLIYFEKLLERFNLDSVARVVKESL